jgi:hypothetical protein
MYLDDKSGDKLGDCVRAYPGDRASVKPWAFHSCCRYKAT